VSGTRRQSKRVRCGVHALLARELSGRRSSAREQLDLLFGGLRAVRVVDDAVVRKLLTLRDDASAVFFSHGTPRMGVLAEFPLDWAEQAGRELPTIGRAPLWTIRVPSEISAARRQRKASAGGTVQLLAVSMLGTAGLAGQLRVFDEMRLRGGGDGDGGTAALPLFVHSLAQFDSLWSCEWAALNSGQIACGSCNRITVLDLGGSGLLRTFTSKSDALAISYAHADQLLVSGARDGRLRVHDARASRAAVTTLSHLDPSVASVVGVHTQCSGWSSHEVLAVMSDGKALLWDLRANSCVKRFGDSSVGMFAPFGGAVDCTTRAVLLPDAVGAPSQPSPAHAPLSRPALPPPPLCKPLPVHLSS
jgi:hypothetical protein